MCGLVAVFGCVCVFRGVFFSPGQNDSIFLICIMYELTHILEEVRIISPGLAACEATPCILQQDTECQSRVFIFRQIIVRDGAESPQTALEKKCAAECASLFMSFISVCSACVWQHVPVLV